MKRQQGNNVDVKDGCDEEVMKVDVEWR